MSIDMKVLITSMLVLAVFAFGCDSGRKIDRRGSVVHEFSFEATPAQRGEFLSGLESIANSSSLEYTRDHLTEQAIREQEQRSVRIAYLTKAFRGDQILVVAVSDISNQSGFVVQIYSGAVNDTEIAGLKSALAALAKTTKGEG